MSYAVYTYQPGATPECHIYTNSSVAVFPDSGLSESDAEQLVAEITAQHSGITTMVLPLELYVSNANQFVVKETGTYEGKPNTVRYFGPYATRTNAEGAQRALGPGGGHEDMQNPTFEILEVTAENCHDVRRAAAVLSERP